VIVFDLRCDPAGHVFEAWFGSSDDYRGQRERGLVSCPLCGSGEIGKAVMAPRIGRGGVEEGARQDIAAGDPAAMKGMLAAMAAVQRKLLASSTYVGEQFPEEARAIHLGEADARPIYGKASKAEAESLAEEGISVTPLPFPVAEPGREN
jgi:hypothetical protein